MNRWNCFRQTRKGKKAEEAAVDVEEVKEEKEKEEPKKKGRRVRKVTEEAKPLVASPRVTRHQKIQKASIVPRSSPSKTPTRQPLADALARNVKFQSPTAQSSPMRKNFTPKIVFRFVLATIYSSIDVSHCFRS